MFPFFQKYLQIDTSHPNPFYDEAISLFTSQAEKDEFDYQIVSLSSGLQAFIATLPGSDESLKSIVLNHHIDVVPAVDKKKWSFPPFEGKEVNGTIFGRGTQDMKGIGFVHYAALRQLKREGFVPRRSIHWIAVPDEEVGGYKGAGCLVESQEFKKLNVGYVLDEGLSSGDENYLLIKVSERKPIQIKLESKGQMVHGSRINCTNAIHELVRFLSKIVSFQSAQKKQIEKQEAGSLLSMNITSFNAGVVKDGNVALNTVPDTAIATIDIRVPPDMTMKEAQKFLNTLLNDFSTITYTVEAQGSEYKISPLYKNNFYNALEQCIHEEGLKVRPLFAEEASDMRFYLMKGIKGLGITPFTIKNNIHGIDEAIRIKDIELGTRLLYRFLKKFCTEE